MEKKDFLNSCDTVSALHFPRWNELPEFDLYIDQVIALTEQHLRVLSPGNKGLITPSMINNYVKSGVLPPPKNKKYNRTHLAILMIVCATKSVMEISAISDIINLSIASDSIETVLDQFAQMYESAICEAVKKAKLTVSESSSNTEHIMSAVAIENALNASAARTVAMYAYSMIAVEPEQNEPEQKSEKKTDKLDKADKKAAKKADKKSGQDAQNEQKEKSEESASE